MPALDLLTQVLSGEPCRTLARPIMRRRATIFLLHRERRDDNGIGGHSQDEVRSAVRVLRRAGARFVSLRELVDFGRRHGEFPRNAVVFTLDDGFADQARLARVLLDEGVPVTMFLITGLIDGACWPWDDRVTLALRSCPDDIARVRLPDRTWQHPLSTATDRKAAARALRDLIKALPQDDLEALLQLIFEQLHVRIPERPPPAYAPLSWSEIRDLEDTGVDFGPHSVTHRIMARLGDSAALHEIAESRRRLREELRRPIDILAWPTGRRSDYSARDQRLARESGLEACVATGDDYALLDSAGGDAALYGLQRFALPGTLRHVLQFGSWLERAIQIVQAPLRVAKS